MSAKHIPDFSRWLSGRPWIPEPASAGLLDRQEARLKPAANSVAELRNHQLKLVANKNFGWRVSRCMRKFRQRGVDSKLHA